MKDKVIVITDRLVLDRQLQETIYQFEHAKGVVVKIDKNSAQLADALVAGLPEGKRHEQREHPARAPADDRDPRRVDLGPRDDPLEEVADRVRQRAGGGAHHGAP